MTVSPSPAHSPVTSSMTSSAPGRLHLLRRCPALAVLLIVGWSVLTSSHAVAADVAFASVFGNHMVLQRGDAAPIWGTADPGASVTITGSWGNAAPVTTTAGTDGRWQTRLPMPGPGGPYSVSATSGDATATIIDVLVGDVWLAGGQSNMEMPVGDRGGGYRGVRNYRDVVASANDPMIRVLDVPNDFTAASQTTVRTDGMRWVVASPETVGDVSATAYFFALGIRERVAVPIGLVTSTVGGTRAEAWMSEAAVRAHGGFDDALEVVRLQRDDPEELQRRANEQQSAAIRALAERDPGIRDGWMRADFDDASWATLPVPGTWNAPDLRDFDGFVWTRFAFDVPDPRAAERGWSLQMGPIDDQDRTWINGTLVGASERAGVWNVPRAYDVGAGVLRPGRNVITVRVRDTGGLGGMSGDADAVRLVPKVIGGDAVDADVAPVSLAGTWRAKRSLSEREMPRSAAPPQTGFNRNLPTVLSNAMIDPLVPMSLRGFIWYQGESNRNAAEQYRTLFPALIADWRRRFGGEALPFYFVQLAPFGYRGDRGETSIVREAQRAALAVPNTGMVITTDIGDRYDIHPSNKQDVGARLARWAIRDVYDFPVGAVTGPIYRSHAVEDGTIRVTFDHVGEGLEARGDRPLTHWQIAGADGAWRPARAIIDGDTVVVRADAVPEPTAVRFGWGASPEPNLFNADGLPASPFQASVIRARGDG